MRSTPPNRTPAEAERVGNALIFLALLGPLVLTDRQRLEADDVAFRILDDSRFIPVWWDAIEHDRQMSILQFVQMPARTDVLVLPRFKYMHPKAQDAFTFRLRQKIRGAIQVLGRATAPARAPAVAPVAAPGVVA